MDRAPVKILASTSDRSSAFYIGLNIALSYQVMRLTRCGFKLNYIQRDKNQALAISCFGPVWQMCNRRPVLKHIKLISLTLLLVASLLAPTSALLAQTQITLYYSVPINNEQGRTAGKLIETYIQEFMQEHPNIVVHSKLAGDFSDIPMVIRQASDEKKPLHLALLLSNSMFDLIDQDQIVAFEDIVTTDSENEWLQSFYPTVMENSSAYKKTWGIPFTCTSQILIYNKDAFRRAALDPEYPPETWKELVDMAKTLRQAEASQWGLLLPSNIESNWIFSSLAMQNNHVLMNGDGNRTYFDDKKAIEALTFWRDLKYKHHVMPQTQITWRDLGKLFLEQRAAMIWGTTGQLQLIHDNAKFAYGVSMLPAGKRRGIATGCSDLFIFKNNQPHERSAALELVKFLTAPERSAQWAVTTAYLGTSPESYDTQLLSDYVTKYPEAVIARDQLEYAAPALTTYRSQPIRDLLNKAIQSVLTEQADPKMALENAQRLSSQLLEPYQ